MGQKHVFSAQNGRFYRGKDYIDPDFKWGNFTIEEQAKVITAARSNNELSPHKMWKEGRDFLFFWSVLGDVRCFFFLKGNFHVLEMQPLPYDRSFRACCRSEPLGCHCMNKTSGMFFFAEKKG